MHSLTIAEWSSQELMPNDSSYFKLFFYFAFPFRGHLITIGETLYSAFLNMDTCLNKTHDY